MDADRTFKDNNGIEWRVSAVDSTGPDGTGRYLCFEAGLMERRLCPFPENWRHVTIQRLEQMCRIAGAVERKQPKLSFGFARPTAAAGESDESASQIDTPTDVVPIVNATGHVSRRIHGWPASESHLTFRG